MNVFCDSIHYVYDVHCIDLNKETSTISETRKGILLPVRSHGPVRRRLNSLVDAVCQKCSLIRSFDA